jgi:peptide chain release factor subunit 1
MVLNTSQKQKLRKFINDLNKIRGRHTELVSVYIPVGYEIHKVIHQLSQEQSTAANIKDKTTRTHVTESIDKMIRHLRLYKKTPEHGLAVFSGDISDNPSKTQVEAYSIEPPEPIQIRLYRCDQNFVLDPLKEMLDVKEVYGLLVMDKREATLGILRGTRIDALQHLTSFVPGKFKAGGQSSQRLERLRDEAAKEFFVKIGGVVNGELLPIKVNIKGIIIGGPGRTKNEFLEADYLNQELKDKVKAVEDVTYTDEAGLRHLVDKAQETLAKEHIIEEKKIMEKFIMTLAKEQSKTAYGYENVKKVLGMGAVATLLMSEALEEEKIIELEILAEQMGTEVRIISVDTKEGEQLRDLGKVAALLRYAI